MTLKKSAVLGLACAGAVLSSSAQVLTQWTFETTPPSGALGAGISSTAYAPDAGIVTAGSSATGHHAGASTYSSPAGDGSPHSFSANTWAVGDYYQFTSSISDFSDVTLSYEQNGSATGPAVFQLSYSIDGSTFNNIGSTYTLPAGITWSAATPTVGADFYSYDLSTISELSGNSTVYFRISDAAATSINGGTTATAGTDRVDDFILQITPTPEPTTYALLGLGAAVFCGFRRRK